MTYNLAADEEGAKETFEKISPCFVGVTWSRASFTFLQRLAATTNSSAKSKLNQIGVKVTRAGKQCKEMYTELVKHGYNAALYANLLSQSSIGRTPIGWIIISDVSDVKRKYETQQAAGAGRIKLPTAQKTKKWEGREFRNDDLIVSLAAALDDVLQTDDMPVTRRVQRPKTWATRQLSD
jgi:hypothetical protein